MKYLTTALSVLLLVTLAALGVVKNQRDNLRHELTNIAAQSAIITETYRKKAEQIEHDNAENMATIASNYDAVIKRLRDKNNRTATAAVARCSKSEQGESAERVRAELLRRLAEVSRYADELREVGGACERYAE